jgi:hypothetical protein
MGLVCQPDIALLLLIGPIQQNLTGVLKALSQQIARPDQEGSSRRPAPTP